LNCSVMTLNGLFVVRCNTPIRSSRWLIKRKDRRTAPRLRGDHSSAPRFTDLRNYYNVSPWHWLEGVKSNSDAQPRESNIDEHPPSPPKSPLIPTFSHHNPSKPRLHPQYSRPSSFFSSGVIPSQVSSSKSAGKEERHPRDWEESRYHRIKKVAAAW
jgi:hypothetical protein